MLDAAGLFSPLGPIPVPMLDARAGAGSGRALCLLPARLPGVPCRRALEGENGLSGGFTAPSGTGRALTIETVAVCEHSTEEREGCTSTPPLCPSAVGVARGRDWGWHPLPEGDPATFGLQQSSQHRPSSSSLPGTCLLPWTEGNPSNVGLQGRLRCCDLEQNTGEHLAERAVFLQGC